jgi:hypothetical protein
MGPSVADKDYLAADVKGRMVMMQNMGFQSEWFEFSFWSPLLTMLALLVVGLLYFLAPVLGYTTYNRGLLLGSMWTLLAKMALTMFKMGIFFLEAAGNPSPMGGTSPNPNLVGLLFPMLESALFMVAMALFVIGLTALRRDPEGMRPPAHRSFTND